MEDEKKKPIPISVSPSNPDPGEIITCEEKPKGGKILDTSKKEESS